MVRLLIVLFLLITGFSSHLAADEKGQVSKALKKDVIVRVELGYLLSVPKDYDTKDSWPVVLFLHGSGERGDDLELVKMHGPPKLINEGKDFPFIAVSPQCPRDHSWDPFALTILLNEVMKDYKVDEDRIYVTGLSMGGFGAWELAAYAPDRFAAIAPICGGGELRWAKRIKDVPIWAFHGAQDKGVPLERSQEMIDAITRHGGTPKLTVYPDAGHDSWTETYNNPEFYEWLLAQKRKPQEKR